MAGARNRGHYWQIWWLIYQEGKRIRKWDKLSKLNFPNKRSAEREAVRREIERDRAIETDCGFREYATVFMNNKHVAASSVSRYDLTIRAFDNFLSKTHPDIKFKEITEQIINDFIKERKLKYSPVGINISLRLLRELFNSAVQKKIIERSPVEYIKYFREEKKVKELPTKDEINKILKWFRENEPLYYLWIYFEATRGWRRDELRFLKLNAVDLRGEMLYIRKTKMKEQRIISLSREDCLVLNEHIILLKNIKLYHPTGYVFPGVDGGLVDKNKVLKKLKKACKGVGITKNITNHSFRHYVVTSILDKTANIEVVKAITGHKDTRTILDHYAHPRKEMVDKALEITRVDTGLLSKKGKKK